MFKEGGRWIPHSPSDESPDIEVSGPDDSDMIDMARKCIPERALGYDEVRIQVSLLDWLINKAEETL